MSRGSSQNSNEDSAREAVVSDALVLEICDDVGTCWDDLGIKLNLSAAAVRNVDADFRRSREKAREILHIWMEKQGNAATVGSLEDALVALQKRAIAQKLLASQIDLQNKGYRGSAQTSRPRARNGDGNHGNPPGVSFGTVNLGSSSHVTLIGYQQGGINLNAPKQE